MSHYDRDPSTGNLIQTAGMRSLNEVKAIMLDICYPVGSIYQSTENVSPATFLGGTWISLSGYMLRGATSGVRQNNNASDGGSDDAIVVQHDHTFTGSAVNSGNVSSDHSHNPWMEYGANTNGNYPPYNGHSVAGRPGQFGPYGPYTDRMSGITANHVHSVTASGTVGSKGSSGTNKNLPKYKNVYMWERTA